MKHEYKVFEGLNYVFRAPNNYEAGKKYPVILLLHGAGTRGEDIKKVSENAYFTDTDPIEDFPFITIAPQCSRNTWFDHFETLTRFVKYIYSAEYTDKSRLYLMGPSMGGYGSWQLAMSMPEYFAAVVPICGGGMYWNAALLKNLPIWAFHGEVDDCVLPRESEIMVQETNRYGGNAKLTIYPDTGHNAWDATYTNPEVFEWLLSHTSTHEVPDAQDWDLGIYG